MVTSRSRKEIRDTLLVMLQSGTIKLKEADYEKRGNPSHELDDFVRTVCFNFDILDELEGLVYEYYQTRRFPSGMSELAVQNLSDFFDTESEIYNECSSDYPDFSSTEEDTQK